MHCTERGVALVTMIFLLALLLVLAMIFSDKVIRTTRDAALTAAHNQGLLAAGAGIEWARYQLANTYRESSGWATYLTAAPEGGRYPQTPAFRLDIDRVTVDIYLRDNPDGDGNPRRDNDLKLFVLACAHPINGPEVLVEGLCIFEPAGSAYQQSGEDEHRSGQSPAVGLVEPGTARVSTFHLAD